MVEVQPLSRRLPTPPILLIGVEQQLEAQLVVLLKEVEVQVVVTRKQAEVEEADTMTRLQGRMVIVTRAHMGHDCMLKVLDR